MTLSLMIIQEFNETRLISFESQPIKVVAVVVVIVILVVAVVVVVVLVVAIVVVVVVVTTPTQLNTKLGLT